MRQSQGTHGVPMSLEIAGRGYGLVMLLVLFGLVGICYAGPVEHIVDGWSRAEYSHGYVIPLVAVLIARHRLIETTPHPQGSWWGAVLLVPAVVMLSVGEFSAQDAITQYGFVLAVAGSVTAMCGIATTRVVLPALVYLLFAIPLPQLLYTRLSLEMQLWSTELGVALLQLLDVAVYQNGNIVDLGEMKLQVVEACNGLRYLFPLASFGFLVALMLRDSWWKRAIVFVSVIPVTILMNSFRIAVIGVTVDLWGAKMAQGLLHYFEGWLVFIACVAILMGEIWLLLRIGARGHFHFEYFSSSFHGTLFTGPLAVSRPALASAMGLLIVALLTNSGHLAQKEETDLPRFDFAMFPSRIGEWSGQRHELDAPTLDLLRLTDYALFDFSLVDKQQPPVNFYAAFYAHQRTGSSVHSPANCIPAGGWVVEDARVQPIETTGLAPLWVNRLLIRQGEQRQLVYYWFEQRGRNLTEELAVKWYLLRDKISYNRSDGALLRVVTPVDDAGEEVAESRLRAFIATLRPIVSRYLPPPIPGEVGP